MGMRKYLIIIMQGIIRFFIFHKPCDLKMVCIFVFFCIFAKDLGTEHNQRSLELIENRSCSTS